MTTATATATQGTEVRIPRSRKTLLGHVPVNSPFYRFHPVTRLVVYVCLSFMPLFIFVPEVNFGLMVVNIILLIIGRVDLRQLRIYLPLIFTVALFMFTVVILAPGNVSDYTPLQVGPITIYFEAVFFTFAAYWRIMAMLFATILYFSTNRERDILVALRAVRLPFVASYVIGLSIRAAGMFMEDFRTIREAEQARGLDTKAMKLSDQVKLYVMYLVPLFSIALRRADEISNALFARGYTVTGRVHGGGKRRDYIRSQYSMAAQDWLVIVVMIALLAAVGIVDAIYDVFAITNSPFNMYLRDRLNIP